MIRKKKEKKKKNTQKPTQSTVSHIVIVLKLWPPDGKNWLTRKDPDAGKDWRREEKGTTEDEMIGWHHRLHGHEFEQAPGVGDGQESLVRCSPWGHKESDMTEWLNRTQTLRRRIRILAPWFSAPTVGIYVQREESKIISSIKALDQWFLTGMILNPRGTFRDKNPGAGREQDCS